MARAGIARRKPGRCEDCGWQKPVRTVHFWLNGMPYTVCAECERPYRGRINWPVLTDAARRRPARA